MPPAILPRDEVVARVLAVVRRQGYEGASLAQLSKATGLGKSSLYHHFPEGKTDMVGAVLGHVADQLEAQVFTPLREPGDPATRLRRMTAALDDFYRHGREACLLATLGIGDAARPFHPRVRQVFRDWIAAISAPLLDAGLSRTTAERRAQDALARFEGAVVLARALGDLRIFERTLRDLPGELLGT